MAAVTGSIGGRRYVTMRVKRIKTWNHGWHVRRHNTRRMACPHIDTEAPTPRVVLGTDDGDVNAGIRKVLASYGITPRPGEVLALEFVVSTSRDVFEGISDEGREQRIGELVANSIQAFGGRFPISHIVSMTVHLDETTPHLHVVVVPVVVEPDRRRKDKAPMARLSAKRIVGGRGDMAREQTRFASHFADMGLVRGQERSRARHVPNREHERMLEDARQAAIVEKDGAQADRVALAGAAVEVGRRGDRVAEREREIDAAAVANVKEAERLAADRAALDAERAKLADEAARLAERAKAVDEERARLHLARVSFEERTAEAQNLKARAISRVKAMRVLIARADEVLAAVAAIPLAQRSPAVREAMAAGSTLQRAREEVAANDTWLAERMVAQTRAAGAGR